MKFLYSTLVIFTLVSCHSLAEVSVEEKIIRQLDTQISQATADLEQVVNINSGTMNFAGVEKVGRFFQKQFDELGFETEWADGKDFDRAGHLIASFGAEGVKGPKILMIGHLDTVFAQNDAFQSYKPLGNDRVAGPGITDMKGGDVIIVNVLKALKEVGALDKLRIKVVMTGDEERSGSPLSASKKAIIGAAKWADIALGFEDGDSNIKTAVVARRGSVDWELRVTGKPAHSSQIFTPQIGYGAIFEAARILNEFREQLAGKGDLTFNPGIILGGTSIDFDDLAAKGNAFGKTNVVAKELLIKGGIRALTPEELQLAKSTMQRIVNDNLAQTQAFLTIGDGYPPMAPAQGNYELLSLYSEVSESLGYGSVVAVNPRNAGAADISFAAKHVDMALDGLGLMGEGGHTKDEVADMSSFAKNMHKAAILIYRLGETY